MESKCFQREIITEVKKKNKKKTLAKPQIYWMKAEKYQTLNIQEYVSFHSEQLNTTDIKKWILPKLHEYQKKMIGKDKLLNSSDPVHSILGTG